MKLTRFFIFGMMVMVMAWSLPVSAADAVKIGVVDFQKVLTQSESGKTVEATMQKRGKEMESGLRDLGAQIEQLNDQLNKEAMVLTKEKRDEKQRELEIKKYDFQNMQKKYQSEFRDLEAKYIDKLKKEIFELAKEIGQKEGYLLVIEQSAVLYYPETIDLTSKLVEAYNKKYPAEKAQPDKAE
jgi:outer membrane protein